MTGRTLGTTSRHVFLGALTATLAVPLYVLLVNAFKTKAAIESSPLSFPLTGLTLDNLRAALTDPDADIVTAYARTALITVTSVGLSVVLGSMASYVIARSTTRWGGWIYLVLVAGVLVPTQVILIPVIRVLDTMGLLGGLPGLVLYMVAGQLPYVVFIYTGFIRSVPRELDESATIDGAGPVRTYWSIVFPLLKPATTAVVIFLGLGAWNNFVDPLVLLGPGGGDTITTNLYRAVGQFNTDYTRVFGQLWLVTVPPLLVYLMLQRQFIAGLTEGAVKG